MKVYYAHSMHLYDTPQEGRDIETLEKLGFEVLNPNNPIYKPEIEAFRKKHGGGKLMRYFNKLIDECQALAFRGCPDGKIGSGVAYEIKYAQDKAMAVIELPTLTTSRLLNYEDTIEYLKLMGER